MSTPTSTNEAIVYLGCLALIAFLVWLNRRNVE